MTIQSQYHKRSGYLLVKLSGQWTETVIEEVLDEIRIEAKRRGCQRLLLDLRKLSKPESEMTRYWSGKYLAEVLPPPFKVAAYADPELINKFGETAAINRSAQFRIFTKRQESLRWLMEGSNSA